MHVAGVSLIPNVLAAEYPFAANNKTICIISSDLNSIKLDGSWNRGSTLATLVENGMDEVSDNTNMNISKITSLCDNRDYGSWLASGYAAKTIDPFGSGANQYKNMKFSTNSAVNFVDYGTCRSHQGDNFEYVTNHEFGHFAGLDYDHNFPSAPTMNGASCTSSYATIKTNDINKING